MYTSGNILPTSGPKEVDAIIIANIQRQSQEREYEIVEDCIGNVKLKTYSSEDSALSKEPGLFQYFCSVCGFHSLVCDKNLAVAERRRTDLSLIIEPSMRFVRYMEKGRKVALKRKNCFELQWRWTCKDCGTELAYQNCPFDERFSNDLSGSKKGESDCCLFIFKNALATEACYCELIETVHKRNNIVS